MDQGMRTVETDIHETSTSDTISPETISPETSPDTPSPTTSIDLLLAESTSRIIREHTLLTLLHSNRTRSRYFQFYFDLFSDPMFSYISFENLLRKSLQNHTLDFNNIESVYETIYTLSSNILQNISVLNINSLDFASNRSTFNKMAYRYSLLYPTVGTYHLMSNAETLFNNSFKEEHQKINHNDTIIRTQSLVKNPVVINKVGMSKHYSELLQKRIMGYITNGLEGAKPKNYYKNTVLDGLISVNRSNLPSTQAESLHICIATGNVSELNNYIRLMEIEYSLDLTSIRTSIETFINNHTAEIEFIKTELLKIKPSNKTSPYLFSEGKNYDKTSCVRIDFDTYHYEMCNLIIPEHHVSRVNAFTIICSEIAALLSSICPNGFLAIDSIIYNFRDGFHKRIAEKHSMYASDIDTNTPETVILKLQYALECLFRAEECFKNNFQLIDSTIDLLKQKYKHETSTYIIDNRIFKWALLQFKSGETYDYSDAFNNFMNILKENFENGDIFKLASEDDIKFKKHLRANHVKAASSMLPVPENLYDTSAADYSKNKTLEIIRLVFPVMQELSV